MWRVSKLLTNPFVLTGGAFGGLFIGYEFIRRTQVQHRYVIGDQTGNTYIVTGANSGIGKELANELAKKNATVIMACKEKRRCLEMRRDIVLKTRNKKVFCRICDLSDFESVHNFVKKIAQDNTEFHKIDGLILNAATKERKYDKNPDGIEQSLATNHMGSFLLVGLLLQKMLEQEWPSKIVFVGTDISARDKIKLELDKLNEAKYTKQFRSAVEVLDTEKGKYDMHAAYKFSKTMQLIFARELAERLKGTQVSVVMADPGGTKTNLNRHEPYQQFFITRWCSNLFGLIAGARRDPEHAIWPILYALAEPDVQNGTFVNPRRKFRGWGANAENEELRQKVWLMSEHWTKLAEHMQRMEEEMGRPNYFSNDPDKPTESKKRSAKFLWLA